MAVRDVLLYPDCALKQVAAPAQPDEIERVGADLVDTMRSFPGCVGIAAPQIGEPVRMIAVDLTGHPKAEDPNGLMVLANPRVAEESAEGGVAREGCLSIPDLTANVRRAESVKIEHSGGRVASRGFEARCLLHEIDHLDGILFLDRVASLVDDLFRRKSYAPPPSEPGTGSSSGSAGGRTR
ncbi:MAG: peptide deformylase [Solirubrobacterales bacterium]|nr:peptide deformylase [Solirubrobacterales bacterium]